MKRMILVLSLCCFFVKPVSAADYTKIEDYDLTEAQDILSENMQDSSFDMEKEIKDMVEGEQKFSLSFYLKKVISFSFKELKENRKMFGTVVMISIMSCFFTGFTFVLKNNQIGDTAFFITYLLLSTILITGFIFMSRIAKETLQILLSFMQALLPAYFISVSASSGSVSAVAFYEFTLILISVVDWLFLHLLLPSVNLYLLATLINNFSKEDVISKLADLIKRFILWTQKTVLALCLGMNVIQGMVLPSVDSGKRTAIVKAVGMLPGIGSKVNSVLPVVYGGARLIKNGIGAVALIALVLLCLFPIIKMLLFHVTYQFAAVAVEPVADKRVVKSIGGVCEAGRLLLRMVMIAMLLFFLTIAIICISTNVSIMG